MSRVRIATWFTPLSNIAVPPRRMSDLGVTRPGSATTASSARPSPTDRAFSELPAERLLELPHRRAGVPFPQLHEVRVAGVPLGIPFVGEPPRRDVIDEMVHRREDVDVGVGVTAGELTILARRRMK